MKVGENVKSPIFHFYILLIFCRSSTTKIDRTLAEIRGSEVEGSSLVDASLHMRSCFYFYNLLINFGKIVTAVTAAMMVKYNQVLK